MKRDMDLIRQIGFAIENATGDLDSTSLKIDGFTPQQIAYHCELMHESELFQGFSTSHLESPFAEFQIQRLTSKGHDFIDAARSDTIWKKTTTAIATAVGGASIDVVIKYLKAQAMATLGLPTSSGP